MRGNQPTFAPTPNPEPVAATERQEHRADVCRQRPPEEFSAGYAVADQAPPSFFVAYVTLFDSLATVDVGSTSRP